MPGRGRGSEPQVGAVPWVGPRGRAHESHPAGTNDLIAAVVAIAQQQLPDADPVALARSEEHTSELQSRLHLVCRLLLEKKKKKKNNVSDSTVRSISNVERSGSRTYANYFA